MLPQSEPLQNAQTELNVYAAIASTAGLNLRFIILSAISLDLHYTVSDVGKTLQFNTVVDHVAQ